MTTYLIRNASVLGGAPTDLLLRDGVVAAVGTGLDADDPGGTEVVDATGLDHPRRAGLALQLGAELDLPTVGVTHRPLRAEGEWPPDVRGAVGPVRIDGEVVASWVRTRAGARPLVVHPGWRTELETAVEVVLGSSRRRTPEPLRLARQAARAARSLDEGQPHTPIR